MDKDLKQILEYLQEKRNFDFTGYHTAMVQRRIKDRFSATKCESSRNYFVYLQENPQELDNLLDVLTINVSRFFRNTLTFEYIADFILPAVFYQKPLDTCQSLRIWSAGCSQGEEAYSAAILINEYQDKVFDKLYRSLAKKRLSDSWGGRHPFRKIPKIL